ncbi:maestro heat-like repeat-containing protein family member 1 [Pristis pectinata]|uniref:maestro heat-like repeat-containing protein family member 1 n=1 Tax=Pristis pectinata TaxID=685728 RepID=UPI00223D3744|nr:maestro heat-like repeat-containing protein family member 1 [Pristis pectinata]
MASGKMEALLNLLLEVPLDDDGLVSQTVFNSLQELGRVDTEGVLTFLRRYITHHHHLPLARRTALLKAMVQMVKDNINNLGRAVAKKLITLASVEMTKHKDVTDEHQEVATRLLLNVGLWFTKETYDELLSLFQPKMDPLFFVVLALANLCKEHVHFMVPLLRPVLRTMVTLLPAVTEAKSKWVFCFALGIFSESILAYLYDIDEAPDPTVKKNLFFLEFSTAYDTLFNTWLPLNGENVSTAVVETLGQITHLVPFDKLENELPRLIPTILALYQGTSSDFCITQGLYGVLHTAVERNSEELALQIDSLLNSLHKQICIALWQPSDVYVQKQRKEILCCFKLLTPAFTSHIIEFLLLKLEINNSQIRLGTLTVLDHLINMVPLYMASQKIQILAGTKLLVLDTNNRVKAKLSQVIHTMATHNYLHLDGGKDMVEFIIRQCALPVTENEEKSADPLAEIADVVTDQNLRRQCEQLMEMLTALPIDNVLWPLLFDFIIPVRCTNALATICNSLVLLAMKKVEAEPTEYFLNYKEHSNIPGPQALLTRLLTMSSSLHQGKNRCIPALTLLQVLGTDIHPATPQVWEKEFLTLLDYLQENYSRSLLQSQWEEKLVKVLLQTLELTADEEWASQFATELVSHLHRHSNVSQEKGFVYKCLGVVLQLSQDEELVKRKLQEMLQTVQHGESLEKEGVAIGFGYCAVTHLDTALTTLKEFAKLNIFKKTASYFQIIKDQENIEAIKVKSTLILCYGHIMSFSPKELTLDRVDTEIMENVLNHYNIKILGMKVEVRDLTLKLSLIKTVTQSVTAIQSIAKPDYNFSRKTELLHYMQELIKAEPTEVMMTPVRKSAINACTSLLKLQPPLKDSRQLIQTCLNGVFSLPRIEVNAVSEHPTITTEERQVLVTETMTSLLDFLKELLLLDLSGTGLQTIFTNMEVWIQSAKEHTREMAIETFLQLLVFYLEQVDIKDNVPSHNLGVIIGCMVLRCTDPSCIVREMAIECLYILLYIQLPANQQDTEVEHLKNIKQELYQLNQSSIFQICTDIGNVLSKCMAQDQLKSLLFTLFNGLTDNQYNGSYSASIIINVLISKCGDSLTDVPEMIKALHHQLQSMVQAPIVQIVTCTISDLVSQHMPVTLPCLLSYPIPFDNYIGDLWRSLMKTNSVATASIKYLLDNLKLLYESSKESLLGIASNSQTHQPLAVIYALHEVICSQDSIAMIGSLYPQLFSTVLIHLSSSVQPRFPRDFLRIHSDRKAGPPQKPFNVTACHYSVEILQFMVRQGEGSDVDMTKNEGWDLLKRPEVHHQGVALLAGAMANRAVPHLIGIVEQLTPVLTNIHESQRITVAAFFGELLGQAVVSEMLLTDTLVSILLRCLLDSSPVVQWLAIKGLGNAGTWNDGDKYASKLLPTMLSLMDMNSKQNTLLAYEAMSTLSKTLDRLPRHYTEPILTDVALGIEPLLEHRQDKVRATAFTTLWKLLQFRDMQRDPIFLEHLCSTLIYLLLHLKDRNDEVRRVCRVVLKQLGPLLASERLCALFEELGSEEMPLDYDNYLTAASLYIGEDLPSEVIHYIQHCALFFSSPQTEMRENAVTLASCLMPNAALDYPRSPAANQVCQAMITLLSDHVQSVRVKTVMAIQRLYMY